MCARRRTALDCDSDLSVGVARLVRAFLGLVPERRNGEQPAGRGAADKQRERGGEQPGGCTGSSPVAAARRARRVGSGEPRSEHTPSWWSGEGFHGGKCDDTVL